jgi:hypothetical protein
MASKSFHRSRKSNRPARPRRARRGLRFETLEERRLLAIVGVVSGTTVSFTGDAVAEMASLTVDDNGYLALNGNTDLNSDGISNDLLAAEITGLTYNDAGANDTLRFEGSNAFNFSSAPAISLGETHAVLTLVVDQAVSISGAGTFAAEAARNIVMSSGSSLTTVDGNVTLRANLGATPAAGNFSGIELTNADISSANGDIQLQGRGGDDAATGFHYGVSLNNGSQVTSTGVGPSAGTITLIGAGGGGTSDNRGVYLVGANTKVSSVDGDIAIHGAGGLGSSHSNHGVRVRAGALVSSTGTSADAADISITGVGGGHGLGGSFSNYGYVSAFAGVSSKAGDIAITGTSGPGGDQASIFVAAASSVVGVESTAGGNISLTGLNSRILVGNTVGSSLATATGAITLTTDSLDLQSTALVQGAGELTIRPLTAGRSIVLGAGAGGLNLSSTELTQFQEGFSSINIGDATSGAVHINGASFADPATVRGNSIAVSNFNSGSGDVTLTAAQEIVMNAGSTIVSGGIVTVNGEVVPGGASPTGRATIDGSLTFAGDNAFTIELNGLAAGADYDQLQVTGAARTVQLGGAALNVSLGFTPAVGDEFVIIDNVDNGSTVAGAFAGLAEGALLTVGGTILRITYQGGVGNNDVVLKVADPGGVAATLTGSQLIIDLTGDGTTGTITVLPSAVEINDSMLSTFDFNTFDALLVRGDVGNQTLVVTGAGTLFVDAFDVQKDIEKTVLQTDVSTTGSQKYESEVDLETDVTLTAKDDLGTHSQVIFVQQVNGDQKLTVDGQLTTEQDANLTVKSLNVKGRAKLAGDITGTGNTLDFEGDVELAANVKVADLLGGVMFHGKVDSDETGPKSLEVLGKLDARQEIGQAKTLASLVVTDRAKIKGGVSTSGDQDYQQGFEATGPLVLKAKSAAGAVAMVKVGGAAASTGDEVTFDGVLENTSEIKAKTAVFKERAKIKGNITTTSEQHYEMGFDATGTRVLKAVDALGEAAAIRVDGTAASLADALTFDSHLETTAALEVESILVTNDVKLGGDIKATGNTVDIRGNLKLAKDVVKITDTGPMGAIIHGTVDSEEAVDATLLVEGKLDARQEIGQAKTLASLVVTDRAKIKGGVSTSGDQDYQQGFEATGPLVLKAKSAAGAVAMVKVGGAAASTGDEVTFDGVLENTSEIKAKTAVFKERAKIKGNITTTSEQHYEKGFDATGTRVLKAVDALGEAAAIRVDGTAASLADALTFDSHLETTAALEVESILVTNDVKLGGDIKATGNTVDIRGNLKLAKDVVKITDTGPMGAIIHGTVDSEEAVDATLLVEGKLDARQEIGQAKTLASLVVTDRAKIKGGVSTSGDQDYQQGFEATGPLVLKAKSAAGAVAMVKVGGAAASMGDEVTFDGVLENTSEIKAKTAVFKERAKIKGNITTTSEQHYEKGFDATGTRVLKAVDALGEAAAIRVDGTAASLADALTFDSHLETTAALEVESILVTNDVKLGGDIKATGNTVDIRGNLKLAKDVVKITDTGPMGAIIHGTVDSEEAVDATLLVEGKLDARQEIGQAKTLASLVVTDRAKIKGGVSTSGDQDYQQGFEATGPLVLKAKSAAGAVAMVKVGGAAASTGDEVTFDGVLENTSEIKAKTAVFKERAKIKGNITTTSEQHYEKGFDATGTRVLTAKDEKRGEFQTIKIDAKSTGDRLRFEANLETTEDLDAQTIRVQGDSTLGAPVKGSGNTIEFEGNVTLAAAVTITDTGTTGVIFHKSVRSDPLGPAHTLNLAGTAPVVFAGSITNVAGLVQESGVGQVTFLSNVSLGSDGATFAGDVAMTNLTFDSQGPIAFDHGTSTFDDTTLVAATVSFGEASTIAIVLQQPEDVELRIEGAALMQSPTLHVTLEFELSPTDAPTFIDASGGIQGEFANVDDGGLTVTGPDGAPTVVNLAIVDGEAHVPAATPGKVTGGGSIDRNVRSFGFVAQGKVKQGALTIQGNIEYQDKDADLKLHSTSLRYVRLEADGIHARFIGAAKVNGAPGYTFLVRLEDNGEPGKDSDVFRIEIIGPEGFHYDSDDFTAGGGVLDGGNIQVHKPIGGSELVVHDAAEEPAAVGDDGLLHSAWQMLIGVHTVAVIDDASAFGAEGRLRISDAIATLNDAFSVYGVTLTEIDSTAGELADFRITAAPDSAAGGAAEGVLGVATHDGLVTIVTGWSWYTGADATGIAPGEYDLQTIVTHELGHLIGLEHSSDANSVMFGSLPDAIARRTLTAQDLSGLEPHDDGDEPHDDGNEPQALRAAGFALSGGGRESSHEQPGFWMATLHEAWPMRTEPEPRDARAPESWHAHPISTRDTSGAAGWTSSEVGPTGGAERASTQPEWVRLRSVIRESRRPTQRAGVVSIPGWRSGSSRTGRVDI